MTMRELGSGMKEMLGGMMDDLRNSWDGDYLRDHRVLSGSPLPHGADAAEVEERRRLVDESMGSEML